MAVYAFLAVLAASPEPGHPWDQIPTRRCAERPQDPPL